MLLANEQTRGDRLVNVLVEVSQELRRLKMMDELGQFIKVHNDAVKIGDFGGACGRTNFFFF